MWLNRKANFLNFSSLSEKNGNTSASLIELWAKTNQAWQNKVHKSLYLRIKWRVIEKRLLVLHLNIFLPFFFPNRTSQFWQEEGCSEPRQYLSISLAACYNPVYETQCWPVFRKQKCHELLLESWLERKRLWADPFWPFSSLLTTLGPGWTDVSVAILDHEADKCRIAGWKEAESPRILTTGAVLDAYTSGLYIQRREINFNLIWITVALGHPSFVA